MSSACPRCGEALTPWLDAGDHSAFGYDAPHTDARCLARVVEQRDEARRERDVAWDDCRDGSCHACAKCFDSLEAQLHATQAKLSQARVGITNALDNLRLDDPYPQTSRAAAIFQLDEVLAALDATEGK